MICHKCGSECVELSIVDSPIIVNQVEITAICRDCGAEHEHSLDGADFELIEPDNGGSPETGNLDPTSRWPGNAQQGKDLFGDDGWPDLATA